MRTQRFERSVHAAAAATQMRLHAVNPHTLLLTVTCFVSSLLSLLSGCEPRASVLVVRVRRPLSASHHQARLESAAAARWIQECAGRCRSGCATGSSSSHNSRKCAQVKSKWLLPSNIRSGCVPSTQAHSLAPLLHTSTNLQTN